MDCYNPVNYSLQSRRRRSVFLFIYLFFFFFGGGGEWKGNFVHLDVFFLIHYLSGYQFFCFALFASLCLVS